MATIHALSASLAVLLTGPAVFFVWAQIPLQIGWVGIDSLMLIGLYFYGIRLINRGARRDGAITHAVEAELPKHVPPLWVAGLGFLLATLVLILTTPWLVRSARCSLGIVAFMYFWR